MECLQKYECLFSNNLTDKGGSYQKLCRCSKKRTCILMEFENVTEKSITEYVNIHKKNLDSYLISEEEGRKLLFVFDLRKLVYNQNWLNYLQLFASVHNEYKENYKTHLTGTIVIVNDSTIKMILNSLFGTIYNPARPILFVSDIDMKQKFSEIWKLDI